MNKILAVLKLAAKFGDKKDVRNFVTHVQAENKSIVATDGHIAIRITSDNFQEHKTQYTIESIEKASKVDLLSVLECLEIESHIHFPPVDKLFRSQERHEIESATFDVKYILKIANALESFRKDLKLTKARLTFTSLSSDKANIITTVVGDLKIEIILMPLRG